MTFESAVVDGDVSGKKAGCKQSSNASVKHLDVCVSAEPGGNIAQRKQAAFRAVLPGESDAPGQPVTPATNYPPSLKFHLFLSGDELTADRPSLSGPSALRLELKTCSLNTDRELFWELEF